MKYLLFKTVTGIGKILALLPMRVLYFISDLLYPLIYYIIKYRKKVVLENLRNSFPEKSEEEITLISKKFYRHFCDILVEILKLFHMSEKEMSRRMHLKNPQPLLDEYSRNKHILMVLGHYNNWEWCTGLCIQEKHHYLNIYKPLTNPYFDDFMAKLRTQYGGEVVPMGKIGRVFMKYILENKLSQPNFIADQSPYEAEIQYWTNFLNQDTPVFLGIEKLAVKTRQPVYYASLRKKKRGYYEMEVEKLCDDASRLEPFQLTEMHVRKLENLIREAPEYWLWTHRRWKSKRKN